MSQNRVIQSSLEIRKTTKPQENKALSNCIETLGLTKIQRHDFICADQTVPKYCSKEASLEAWEYPKQRSPKLERDISQSSRPSCIFRTKANCLRVYCSGSIMVDYPDGVWYHLATPEVIEGIIQKHLIRNKVVEEYVFLVHPLSETSPVSCQQLIKA